MSATSGRMSTSPARETRRRAEPPRRRGPAPGRRNPGRQPRRGTSLRRRSRLLVLAVLVLCACVVLPTLPLFQRAIRDLGLPLRYAPIIRQQAAIEHLDPALVAAVIYAETRFDARTSPTGAEGLMQLEPATAEFLAHRSGGVTFTVTDLGTPQVNIAYGCYYLRYLLDEFHGSVLLALAAYNGGETNTAHWLAASGGNWHTFTVNDIPFPATRAYVAKVLAAESDYAANYPGQLG